MRKKLNFVILIYVLLIALGVYGYTPIGKIENAAGLKKAVGRGSVKVEFSL